MNLNKPKRLQIGDTIGIIAPSGNVNIEKIMQAKSYFEKAGYKVKLGKNIEKCQKYLAGTDEERLEDLHNAFLDKEINAIICARGGYGALRLISKIDYNVIKNNPKIFCGYSDITILNAMFLKRANLISFSGAMAQSDFADENINDFTKKEFFKSLSGENNQITPETPIVYNSGDTKGILFGGNLATITSLCGVDFIPDEKFIFFAEDLNEPVYKIDRYFRQLLNIQKFKENITGIILGDFLDIDNQEYFDNLFKELAEELKIPIIGGFPISHSDRKTSIPYGAVAQLNNNSLIISSYTI